MATASMFQDEFNCSICLDLLKDPVTIPCGHSFCLNCITGCWDQEDQKGVYSCPQCRETFTPRPVLYKNTMMVDMLEKLKKTELRSNVTVSSDAKPGDVECDFCTGIKHKAIKSCLSCLLSYCEVHIQPHYEVPRLSKHKLVNATSQLQDRICTQHDRIIELFCRTDQQLICMLCSMDDHNGHKTVSAAAERTEKQKQLVKLKGDIPSQIQQREKEVEEVKQALKSLQASAQEAVEYTDHIFTELISFMQKRSEVTESIRAQERAEVSRAEGLLEQLELEITKLKSRNAEMEKLQPIEDPIDFIQSFQSHFTSSTVAETLPKVTFESQFSFHEVMKSVSPSLREKTKEFHQAVFKVTGLMVMDTVILKTPETISKSCRPYPPQSLNFNRFGSNPATGFAPSAGTIFGEPSRPFGHSFGHAASSCGYDHNYTIPVDGVGVLKALNGPDNMTVDFPELQGWKGSSSKLELVLLIN
ncbi:E3 ubiquitin/ISG15 ligase TRIM25-like [Alosa sapidissima]|uniref:E3 ubiquitin/ISG15 ligase TRIM25-like n=1 Tax=Alosa sapidissima TaxID=34773 RepID=UPI001C083CF0|nr:E3 ubiquitin/ISG15 ligase TRIM25-like [Alosa sapidissima]